MFQGSDLFQKISYLPVCRLIVDKITIFFSFVLRIRMIVFVGVAFYLGHVFSCEFAFFPFKLKHILLHHSFLMESSPLVFEHFLWYFSQSHYFLLEGLKLSKVSSIGSFLDLHLHVLVNFLCIFDFIFNLRNLPVNISDLGIDLIE